MAAPMERTRHPGIYKRGSRYVVTYRLGGKQKKESTRTLEEARRLKATRQADLARGELQEATRVPFGEYAAEWVERYQGRGRGFRDSTRDDYRRSLEQYAVPYFGERLSRRLSEVTPRDIAGFIGWLCDPKAQAQHEYELAKARTIEEAKKTGRRPKEPKRRDAKRLSDSTVRNICNPIRACYATAVNEGLVRFNPTHKIALPHRPGVDDDEAEEVRALTREQLAAVLDLVHERHRLFFRFLAASGLRISEAIAVEWRHLQLDGSHPHVKVRRAIVRGRVSPPKTRHGRREVPLGAALVSELRRHHAATEWPGDEDLVFPSLTGSALSPNNLRRRALAPIAEEVGVPWASFHTFRHTAASLLFERGKNAVQVQRFLGHHSASFTLDTYVHLLKTDLDEPLELDSELKEGERDPAELSRGATK